MIEFVDKLPNDTVGLSKLFEEKLFSALNNEKIIKFCNLASKFSERLIIQAIINTGLVKLDTRHIDEKSFELKEQVFWQIAFDPNDPNSYAHSRERQPLHTDNGWFNNPPEISFFIMKKQAPNGGASTFYRISDIINDLMRKNLNLFDKITDTKVTIQKTPTERNITEIVNLNDNTINWNYYRILKDDNNIRKMCEDFFEFLEFQERDGFVSHHMFNSGDCYILPDQKMLHGRKEFEATAKNDRVLLHSQWKLK
jgi:hypothetical protein